MSEPRPDGRTLRFAHRRGELLEAVADHVAQYGLADLRLRGVADALQISHRTLLHHFHTKEQLLGEVLRELRDRDRVLIATEAGLLADARPTDVLEATWQRIAAPAGRGYWAVFFQAYGLALKDRELYADFLEGIVTDWLALAEELLEQAGVPAPRREALATLTLAALRGLLLDRLVSDDATRTDAAVGELATLLAAVAEQSDAGRER